MTFDPDHPLDRISGETKRANAALLDYYAMGDGRSFVKLLKEYQKNAGTPPTKRLGTLKIWSIKHCWQARIEYQKQIDNALLLSELQAKNISHRQNMIDVSERLVEKALSMLQWPIAEQVTQQGDTTIIFKPAKWRMADAARMVEIADKIFRLALGLSTEHIEVRDWRKEAKQSGVDVGKMFEDMVNTLTLEMADDDARADEDDTINALARVNDG